MKTLHIFYHSADLDGMCSGAIVKYWADKTGRESHLHGINYGDEFPWNEVHPNDEVIMTDFSLQPWSDMKRLAALYHVTWIDHHKSAIEEHSKGDYPLFSRWILDTEYAACELTWMEYFGQKLPLAVFWLGRYDIWKHQEHEGCLEFQYGMRLYDTQPENQAFWKALFTEPNKANTIRDQGTLLLAYETEQNKKFASAYSFECELDGLRCIAVNKGFTNSLVFQSVYDPSRHDAMLSFAYRGGKWTVSLYSDKESVDCSVICKARGGGGHKGAAGFQCDVLPFLSNDQSA